jgi:pyruvate, orthophosphate dikinase
MADRDLALRALRIKGYCQPANLAGACRGTEESCAALGEALEGEGLVTRNRLGLKLTEAGAAAADALMAADREAADGAALERAYDAFIAVNKPFKELVMAWMARPDGSPNDHSDPAYDQGVLERLDPLHEGVGEALATAGASVPRLAVYQERFDGALERVKAGEHRFLTAPLIDSYHTVWFELHEDLIRLLGRTRAGEAAAGRAH